MAGPFFTVLAGCVLSLAFGIPSARGRGGLLQFSGAVVAPTCASVDVRSLMAASNQPGQDTVPHQFACAGADGVADVARSYVQTVTALDAAAAGGDRVLAYFAGYAGVAGHAAGGALVVTRSFQ
jgi:hypothetical protein